jgi:hypothetical protein
MNFLILSVINSIFLMKMFTCESKVDLFYFIYIVYLLMKLLNLVVDKAECFSLRMN